MSKPTHAAGHHRPRRRRWPSPGMVGVTVVLVAAGALFTTSAETARGTQLRADRSDAVGLVRAETGRLDQLARQVQGLRQQNEALSRALAPGNSALASVRQQAQPLVAVAGLEAVTGPGLVITLDDAPHTGALPPNITGDDLVVHQQDVEAVVNALWAGGAEAMELMDQRVILTSAVRCVGNTLILQGRVYSPPYRVAAIGNVTRMRKALADSPYVSIYQGYVHLLGLGWTERSTTLTLPAFNGSLELRYAQIPGQPWSSASGSASASPSGSGSGTRSGTGTGSGPGAGTSTP